MSNDRADALGSAVPPHTPGPWEVAYLDNHGQRVVRAEHIEVCTCWHHCVGSIEREMEANARLIAAAPQLYDALERAAHVLRDAGRNGDAREAEKVLALIQATAKQER